MVDIASTPWDYACRLKKNEMKHLSGADAVISCSEFRRGMSAENLGNVLAGLILHAFAAQNANCSIGLSTGGFPYAGLSANIQNQW
ncbi:MAG: hypothetical protein ACLQDM_30145 [Bradyrhizobium sp.]